MIASVLDYGNKANYPPEIVSVAREITSILEYRINLGTWKKRNLRKFVCVGRERYEREREIYERERQDRDQREREEHERLYLSGL